MRLFKSHGLLVSVAFLLSACAVVPVKPEKTGFTLPILDSHVMRLEIQDARRPVTAELLGCGSAVEFDYTDFSPRPLDYLAQALAVELEREDSAGKAAKWLAGRSIQLLEFRAIAAKKCPSGVDPNKNSGMAAISPIGPLVGNLLDSLASHALREPFVQIRFTVGAGGREFGDEFVLTNLDRPAAKLFEPIAEYAVHSIAQKIVAAASDEGG